jgi:hypothetical protein
MPPNQPPEEDPARDSHLEPPVVTPVTIALVVACTVTALTVVAISFEISNHTTTISTIRGTMVGATLLSWFVYGLALLDHRWSAKFAHLQELVADRRRTAEYAEGYVDCAARNVPKQQSLRAVAPN